MVISLVWVGKTTAPYLASGIALYQQRLTKYGTVETVTVPDVKRAHLTFQQQKEAEGRLLLQKFAPGDFVVLLDERGTVYSSEEFSRFIENRIIIGTRKLVFVTGGPYGFSDAVYERADMLLSLSKMTFSHQMVRLLFIEQLYRAFTILRGEPYHHA